MIWLASALALFAIFLGEFFVMRLVLAVALGLAVFDLLALYRTGALTMSRHVPGSLPVNRGSGVELWVEHHSDRDVTIELTDEVPLDADVEGLPLQLRVAQGERATVSYTLLPKRRGDADFGAIAALIDSPLGLWQRRQRFVGESSASIDAEEPEQQHITGVKVYPDFSIISDYLHMVSDLHLSRAGLRLVPRRGEGLEFHQLREYRQGDAMRQIDWKATARRRDLISREYQEERDQHVFFLVDSGRRMRAKDGRLSHFDHSLNALLLLSYVALRQGDSVSVLTFGGDSRFIAPQRGVGSISRLLGGLYDVHTAAAASDYIGAAQEALRLQRKRALVVLVTNLREEDADLAPALTLLRQRHFVLLANLRERALDEQAELMPESVDEALTVAGTHDYLKRRADICKKLAAAAHLQIDSVPQQLPIAVVNAYWQIKRSGAL